MGTTRGVYIKFREILYALGSGLRAQLIFTEHGALNPEPSRTDSAEQNHVKPVQK